MKYLSVRLSERKTSEKKSSGKRGGGQYKSFRISVIARVRNNRSLFQSFLYTFRGTGSCQHGGVSIITSRPQVESQL